MSEMNTGAGPNSVVTSTTGLGLVFGCSDYEMGPQRS